MTTRVAEMIDKEIVIALAKEAGFEMWVDDLHKLCTLAIAHAQKDAGKTLITPGGGAPGDPCGILAAKDAEPVAWIAKQEDGGLLLWDASYKLIQEGYDLGFNKNSRRLKYYPLYTHPAHDDTALLRQALEALKELWDNFGVVCPSADLIDQYEAAITALRERLGEKV